MTIHNSSEKFYSNLLSSERFRKSTKQHDNILLDAESDRGRLLFCPAFRRLQQKAQVFSLEANAAVRSRLTHSLEVSHMGRYIADQISIRLIEKNLATKDQCAALTTFVEAACLMHDIGNPPFGHFGEAAIAEWFRTNGISILSKLPETKDKRKTKIFKKHLSDFYEFDGNPQGIRVVTKLQRNSDEYGLNLTYTTIASYLKYIRATGEDKNENRNFQKKGGYFQTENEIIGKLWSHFGYKEPQRFPLAYIMEAADDIAYCISDLEDSIEKGLISKEKAFEEINSAWTSLQFSDSNIANQITKLLYQQSPQQPKEDRPTYTDFRTQLNQILVNECADIYIIDHDNILKGETISLIPEASPGGQILAILRNYCRDHVYCHPDVEKIEIAGYGAIYGLLDSFSCLLSANIDRFDAALKYKKVDNKKVPIIIEKKLLSLFPKNYIKTYQEDLEKLNKNDEEYYLKEWNLRAHLVVDFLSGMTDDYSVKIYQILAGISL